jgi:hypothetical protein
MYAAEILAIFVNGLTKLSICVLIRQISNDGSLRMANLALGGVIVGWIVVGLFTTAFQCPLPDPWLVDRAHRCSSRGPIFVFNGVMNILTDVGLCVLPIMMMWHVQAKLRKKVIVTALFGSRVLFVPLTFTSSNSTWTEVGANA